MIDYDKIIAIIVGIFGIIYAIWFMKDSENYAKDRDEFNDRIDECMEVLNGTRKDV